jgi:hypothetical protein
MADPKVQMSPTEILQMINSVMSLAADLYSTLDQIQGKTPIPTWGEITDMNAILQAKIDAEK